MTLEQKRFSSPEYVNIPGNYSCMSWSEWSSVNQVMLLHAVVRTESHWRLYGCLRHGSQSLQQRYFLSSSRGIPVPFAHSITFNYVSQSSRDGMLCPRAQVLIVPSRSSMATHWSASQPCEHCCYLLAQRLHASSPEVINHSLPNSLQFIYTQQWQSAKTDHVKWNHSRAWCWNGCEDAVALHTCSSWAVQRCCPSPKLMEKKTGSFSRNSLISHCVQSGLGNRKIGLSSI